MDTNIFDTKKLIQYKNSIAHNWDDHNFIYKKFAENLYIKINEINSKFPKILLVTSDVNESLNELKKLKHEKIFILSQYKNFLDKISSSNEVIKIHGSFDDLSFQEVDFDLIIHNFCLHNLNNIESHIKKIFLFLKNDGLFMCNFFGGKTLNELRQSLILTDEKLFKGIYPRMSPTLKMVDIVDMFARIGFKEIVSDSIEYKIFYKNVFDLLIDIKGVGENTVFKNVKKGLKTKKYLDVLNKIYSNNFSLKNKIHSTCEVISITCWKQKA